MTPSASSPATAHQHAKLGQIYYDAESRAALDPDFEPLHNPEPSPFFEADVVRRRIRAGWHGDAALVGIFSWRFGMKIPLTGSEVRQRLASAPDADVYSFFGALSPGPIWQLAERKHPGILPAADALLRRLGWPTGAADVVAAPIYQHHFVARASVYENFVDELLGPALDRMSDADDEFEQLLAADSGYSSPRVPAELLRRIYGRDYFPLHAFVAERLFSTWVAAYPELRIEPIWDGRFVEASAIEHEPELPSRAQ